MKLTISLSKHKCLVRIIFELFLPLVVWIVAGHLIAVRVFDWVYVVRFGMYADMHDALLSGAASYVIVFIWIGIIVGMIHSELFKKVHEYYGWIV